MQSFLKIRGQYRIWNNIINFLCLFVCLSCHLLCYSAGFPPDIVAVFKELLNHTWKITCIKQWFLKRIISMNLLKCQGGWKIKPCYRRILDVCFIHVSILWKREGSHLWAVILKSWLRGQSWTVGSLGPWYPLTWANVMTILGSPESNDNTDTRGWSKMLHLGAIASMIHVVGQLLFSTSCLEYIHGKLTIKIPCQ